MHRATDVEGTGDTRKLGIIMGIGFYTFVYDIRRTGANRAVTRSRVSGRDQPDQVAG